ncbi:MAG: hypothetical protein KIS78_31415, partial [Labilithrix sp.]|nr:hypothetical protein [Labilithrix sp.]
MADSDVIGILSLVLAAAGAAYLVWTRVLRASPRPGVPDARATAGDERAAETMPPALRPPSEISPTMRARQEARGTSASARPPPSSSTSESPPSTSEPPKPSSSTSESSTPEP